MFYSFPNLAAPITLAQRNALRLADKISFHHNKERSYIRATREATNSNPFEASIEIDCNTRFDDYTSYSFREKLSQKDMKCFEMIHSSKRDDIWQTIAKLAREGDMLMLHWERGAATTEGIKDAGMVGDKLKLIIKRGDKLEMTFLLDSSIGHDNTARMIQGPLNADMANERTECV